MDNHFDFCLKFISFNLINDAGACPQKFQLIDENTAHEVYQFFAYFPFNTRDIDFYNGPLNGLI